MFHPLISFYLSTCARPPDRVVVCKQCRSPQYTSGLPSSIEFSSIVQSQCYCSIASDWIAVVPVRRRLLTLLVPRTLSDGLLYQCNQLLCYRWCMSWLSLISSSWSSYLCVLVLFYREAIRRQSRDLPGLHTQHLILLLLSPVRKRATDKATGSFLSSSSPWTTIRKSGCCTWFGSWWCVLLWICVYYKIDTKWSSRFGHSFRIRIHLNN